jgi:hypothetical protein
MTRRRPWQPRSEYLEITEKRRTASTCLGGRRDPGLREAVRLAGARALRRDAVELLSLSLSPGPSTTQLNGGLFGLN